MAHVGWIATVGLEVCDEVQHRLVVTALGGKQQPLGIQVVNDRDVVLAPAQAGLVDANDLHAFEALLGASLIDVELDAPPQLLVLAAQQLCGLANGQLAAQRQCQGLKRGREAKSRGDLAEASRLFEQGEAVSGVAAKGDMGGAFGTRSGFNSPSW